MAGRIESEEKEQLRTAVYAIVALIPLGRATSYGAIARAAGFPQYSRMVGRMMAWCDSRSAGLPAHRVVNSQGVLTARAVFGNKGEMERLLEAEGIEVRSGRIRQWKRVFWDPQIEL